METINHEYYVSLEVAKLLKEAGFDWEICDGYIIYEDGHVFTTNFQTPYNFNGDNKDLFSDYRGHREVLSIPTLDVAQRWLREVKNCQVEIMYTYDKYGINMGKYVVIYTVQDRIHESLLDEESKQPFKLFEVYEKAQEAGIKKALELILEKGE